MRLIPVLDLMGNSVVHARRGLREHYRPIASVLSQSHEPCAVVDGFLSCYPFSCMYIADLDSLRGNGNQFGIVTHLVNQFPQVEFWVDAGKTNIDEFPSGVVPVIGSESLLNPCSYMWPRNAVLSLDYRQGKMLGPETEILQTGYDWPDNVIHMNLDYIGASQGPDWSGLQALIASGRAKHVIAAGGVRHIDDVLSLETAGVRGVLLATALHTGLIKGSDVSALMERRQTRL